MKEYITYKCKICGCSFILPIEHVKYNEEKGNYVTCPYRGHKNIVVTGLMIVLKNAWIIVVIKEINVR